MVAEAEALDDAGNPVATGKNHLQRNLIAKIDAALQRIQDGIFGYCEGQGSQSIERLEARTTAILSQKQFDAISQMRFLPSAYQRLTDLIKSGDHAFHIIEFSLGRALVMTPPQLHS